MQTRLSFRCSQGSACTSSMVPVEAPCYNAHLLVEKAVEKAARQILDTKTSRMRQRHTDSVPIRNLPLSMALECLC